MLDTHPWLRDFTVTDDDIDYLTNLLLETETPRNTIELALILLQHRLDTEQAEYAARYKDAQFYNPADDYAVGDRVVFTQFENATASVVATRPGDNPEHDDFSVIAVEFDEARLNVGDTMREFAANLGITHPLNEGEGTQLDEGENGDVKPEAILSHPDTRRPVLYNLHQALEGSDSLTQVGGYWFPAELVMETDIGTLHLSEAMLDMIGGGPMPTTDIIEGIGTLGEAPMALQTFSLNFALKKDDRFDEVGPSGEVMWYLARMEPEEVLETPAPLRYRENAYDEDILSDAMMDLETELDDEITPVEFEGRLKRATSVLLYPHRRGGTLPLNAKNRAIFPYARTPRIHVELVDKADGETFGGWVVHEGKYVYGLADYYQKHQLPVGAYLTVARGEKAGQIILSHEGYKPRTEYIRVLLVRGDDQFTFENTKRSIGAAYDDLMIVGVDNLQAVDKLAKAYADKELKTLMRMILSELGRLTPQGTVHAVTLYSAVNILRRCPPGPIFATLISQPEFEDVGDYYWQLNK